MRKGVKGAEGSGITGRSNLLGYGIPGSKENRQIMKILIVYYNDTKIKELAQVPVPVQVRTSRGESSTKCLAISASAPLTRYG